MGDMNIAQMRAELKRIRLEDAYKAGWLAEKPTEAQQRALMDVGTRKFTVCGFRWCKGASTLSTDLAALQPKRQPDGAWFLCDDDAKILMILDEQEPTLNRALTNEVRGKNAGTDTIKSHTDRMRNFCLIRRINIGSKISWVLTPEGLAEKKRRA